MSIIRQFVTGPKGDPGNGAMAYGSFFSSADQDVAAADTPQVVTLSGEYGSSGVSVVAGSRVTFAAAGVYTISFVGQVQNLSSATADVFFWIRYNGADFANSTTELLVPARKSAGVPSALLATFTLTGQATTAGDYIEVYWQATSVEVSLEARPATTIPATPSIIVSIAQIATI